MDTSNNLNGFLVDPSQNRCDGLDEVYAVALTAEDIAIQADNWTHILLVMDVVQMLFIVYLLYRG